MNKTHVSKLLALGLVAVTTGVGTMGSAWAEEATTTEISEDSALVESLNVAALVEGPKAVSGVMVVAEATEDTQVTLDPGWRQPAGQPEKAASAPGLVFETTDYDFGSVEEGEKVNIEFNFTNTSDKTITINKIKPSCGCTAADLKQKVFEPGQGDTIKAIFNSSNRSGIQHKTLTVDTDDPDNPTYRLQFKGEVVSKVYATERILQFGDLMQGDTKTLEFAIVNISGEEVKVLSTQSTAGAVKIEVKDPEKYTDPKSNREGVRIPVSVTIPSDYPVGRLSANLSVQTDYTSRPNFIVVMNGNIRGELSLEPERLYFGILTPNDAAERDAKLVVAEGKTFSMSSFEVDNVTNTGMASKNGAMPKIDVKVLDNEGEESQQVHIAFTAPETPGRYMGNVVLTGKVGEDEKSLTIPYNAYVRAVPVQRTQTEQPTANATQ